MSQGRAKPYLPQICGTIKWRLNNKSAKIRQQAADLIARIAVVMKACDEEKLLGHLGVVLYEYLGEEYPDVLGSILGALKAIVNVIGMTVSAPMAQKFAVKGWGGGGGNQLQLESMVLTLRYNGALSAIAGILRP